MGNPVLCENSGSRQRDDQSSMIWLGLRPISPHEILLFIFTIEPWNRGITFRCERLWHLKRSQQLPHWRIRIPVNSYPSATQISKSFVTPIEPQSTYDG